MNQDDLEQAPRRAAEAPSLRSNGFACRGTQERFQSPRTQPRPVYGDARLPTPACWPGGRDAASASRKLLRQRHPWDDHNDSPIPHHARASDRRLPSLADLNHAVCSGHAGGVGASSPHRTAQGAKGPRPSSLASRCAGGGGVKRGHVHGHRRVGFRAVESPFTSTLTPRSFIS